VGVVNGGQQADFSLESLDNLRITLSSSQHVWHLHLDCNGHTFESSKPHNPERALPQDGSGNAISLHVDVERIFIQLLPRVICPDLGSRRSTWLHVVVDGNG
jgi:hypothetical protein